MVARQIHYLEVGGSNPSSAPKGMADVPSIRGKPPISGRGGIGIRAGLRIQWAQARAGSTPAAPTQWRGSVKVA